MIEDVFQANKGKVGIVLYSVTGTKLMNGKPVTLSEGVLKLKDKAAVNRRGEVDKAVRALLKQHGAKGDDPAGCSFYVIKEDGDVQLCSMVYDAGKKRGS